VAEQDTEQEEQPQAEQKTEQKLEKEALAKKKQQQLADQKAAEVKQNATMTSMIPYILAARQQASANVAPQQGAQSTTASTPATHTSSSSTTFTGPFTASALPPERFEALLNLVETAEQKDLIVNGLATMFITLTPEQIQKLDEKIAKSTSQQTGQQNLTNQQDVQQGGAKTLTVSEFLQGLGNAKAENGVMKGVKKSISDIKTLSALRKFKNELNKLMKGINPTFRPLLNKKPNKAAVARRTKQQNQWIASVKTWLNKLNQSDQSALGLTIHPTDNPITLALSQRKPIINAFSALLKDLNQQNTTIIKANRAKKLAKQEELRAKKKTKKAEEKNKGRNRRRRIDTLSMQG
jgi:hypothetical protein